MAPLALERLLPGRIIVPREFCDTSDCPFLVLMARSAFTSAAAIHLLPVLFQEPFMSPARIVK
jgi:hypothetical protein